MTAAGQHGSAFGEALAEARGEIGAIIAQAGDGAEMLDDIMAGPVAALIAGEREQIAAVIEADPGSHYVPTRGYCIQFADDEDMADTGCGQDPCPGHSDGFSVIHGREHYARIARGAG